MRVGCRLRGRRARGGASPALIFRRKTDAAAPQTQPHSRDPRHVAVHEAGHAVIGKAMGLRPEHVTIRPTPAESLQGDAFALSGHAAGQCRVSVDGLLARYSAFSVIRRRVITAAAGAVAEQELLGSDCGGDSRDREMIGRVLRDFLKAIGCTDSSDAAVLERHLRRITARLARRHRAAIASLAGELMERGELGGEELQEALVEGALPRPWRRYWPCRHASWGPTSRSPIPGAG